MPELARAPDVDGRRGARVLRPAGDLGARVTVGHDLHPAPFVILHEEAAFAFLPVDALLPQVRPGVVERAGAVQLEAGVVLPWHVALDELQAVWLVVAREQRPPAFAASLDEPELDRPAGYGLVEVGHAQADVVEQV
jgi:hypothetical protein